MCRANFESKKGGSFSIFMRTAGEKKRNTSELVRILGPHEMLREGISSVRKDVYLLKAHLF